MFLRFTFIRVFLKIYLISKSVLCNIMKVVYKNLLFLLCNIYVDNLMLFCWSRINAFDCSIISIDI